MILGYFVSIILFNLFAYISNKLVQFEELKGVIGFESIAKIFCILKAQNNKHFFDNKDKRQ